MHLILFGSHLHCNRVFSHFVETNGGSSAFTFLTGTSYLHWLQSLRRFVHNSRKDIGICLSSHENAYFRCCNSSASFEDLFFFGGGGSTFKKSYVSQYTTKVNSVYQIGLIDAAQPLITILALLTQWLSTHAMIFNR